MANRLRTETRAAHEAVEAAFDLDASLASVNAYRGVVQRFYGFHAMWEPIAAAKLAEPDLFEPRRRLALLLADLRALGLASEAMARLPLCEPMAIPNRAAALGSLYVVEGATLGGVVISRQVERRLGLTATTGCAYFRGYGPETAGMWKRLGARLVSTSWEWDDTVVKGAKETFAAMERWLRGAAP